MGVLNRILPNLEGRASSWSALMAKLQNNLHYGSTPYRSGYHDTSEAIPDTFESYAQQLYKSSAVVYMVAQERAKMFSQMRFKWRPKDEPATPFNLFGTRDLELLENPWPGGTTTDLCKKAIQDVDLCGNFFCVKETSPGGKSRLRRLRPDWVVIELTQPADQAVASDILYYAYYPGGIPTDVEPGDKRATRYTPEECAHWAPQPDPEAMFRGMTWLTPAISEILIEQHATRHLKNFFKKGAQLGLVAMVKEEVGIDQMRAARDEFMSAHAGSQNAYEPMFLGAGYDLKVVQQSLRELDLKTVRGHVETHIAGTGGVPATVVGLSEGQNNSSLAQGNYKVTAEGFIERTMRDLWKSFCEALDPLLEKPRSRRGNVTPSILWYSDADISVLNRDRKDDAGILKDHQATVNALVAGGFTAQSAKDYVETGNIQVLEHTGYISVQLWKPGQGPDNGSEGSEPTEQIIEPDDEGDQNEPEGTGEPDPISPKGEKDPTKT